MAQRDKVKELVGRGLNSYHTKALQQMDRIEKKNKEQNHKISMLTNELDNDYLTKTQEGSVISLDHSKEGMVYIDSLEGNTMVNYCTDGSKELTLNGDIDLEGTFVTTTEGVDNGKVDVMCEGNTLVNLLPNKELKITCNNDWDNFYAIGRPNATSNITFGNTIQDVKPNTTYTLIYNVVTRPTSNHYLINNVNASTVFDTYVRVYSDTPLGINKVVLTTLPDLTDKTVVLRQQNGTGRGEVYIKDYILLEGDWTNKEIPQYFEGMKSVGECEDNKIEILSQNKNLFNINETDVYSSGTRCEKNGNSLRIIPTSTPTWASHNIKIKGFKNGETYALSCISDNYHLPKSRIALYERATNTNVGSWDRNYFTIPNNVNVEDIYLRIHCCDGDVANIGEVEISDILIEKGQAKTQFIPYAINKKEILLNEPLRGLPSGVKDYFIKQGGKWYIQRNVGEYIFKGNEINSSQGSVNETNLLYWNNAQSTLKNKTNVSEVLSNKLPHGKQGTSNTKGIEGISFNGTGQNLLVDIKKTMTETNEFLKDSKIIYQLETPTYEEITDPTLIIYLDVTHISNNSIIPCNMKVKNSGYNAIIKPSTLYTVALDTNKSGTIGMNLGGVKGTTTNNVLTLTTPATLTDDSLRLYGKGIKGSKVRLLEGDKTNWIPSHFEGMKSSFEDKFDATDNTYKMEILSNNKNLIDIERMLNKDNYLKGTYSSIKIPLKPNTTYYFKCDFKPDNIQRWIGVFSEPLGFNGTLKKTLIWSDSSEGIKEGGFITDKSTDYYLSIYQPNVSYVDDTWYEELFTSVYNNFIISEVDKNYIEGKSNKIQFSSIKPLRSLPNGIKDKFIFKDEKLMIERNCGEIIFDGSEIWLAYNSEYNINNIIRLYTTRPENSLKPNDNTHINYMISDKLFTPSNGLDASSMSNNLHSFSTYISYGTGTLSICLPKSVLSSFDEVGFKEWLSSNTPKYTYQLAEPTYEEVPFELQKIILEGYENGTLFFDTNIPPTSVVTYAGETPIVKSVKLNKTEVSSNTDDINDNIIPYLMDMDYRVVCLQLATEEIEGGVSMARLFGGAYEMLKRDILSKRLTREEYGYRLADYYNAGKLTEEQVRELEDLR